MKISLLLLILLLSIVSYAQEGQSDCQKCEPRIILCRDLQISTPQPVTAADSLGWKQLHDASDGYIKNLINRTSPECFGIQPACRIGSDIPPWSSPCPRGGESQSETHNIDYEIYGDITGSEGAYVISLNLVSVKSETVATVTKKFEKASDASFQGGLAILNLGGNASGSKPFYDLIHDFELKKRDAAQGIKYNEVALNASVRFASERKNVRVNERLPVEIELKDCDDEPLKSAKLVLHVAEGQFEKNEIETDENGLAHIVYIAPDKEGTADVKVEYNYNHPSGKIGFESDFVSLEVIQYRLVEFTAEDYTVEHNKTIPIVVRLSGCDSKAMQEATIELSAQKGTFDKTKVKPDAKGYAYLNYKAPEIRGNDPVKVVHKFKALDGSPLEISDERTINITKPVAYLTGKINVVVSEKITIKNSEGTVIKTVKTNTRFETILVFKVNRLKVSMMEDKSYRESAPGKGSILSGISTYEEWNYSKSKEPVMKICNDIHVNISSKTEGYRKSINEDWGEIHTFETEATDNFEFVRLSFTPEQPDQNLSTLGVQLPYIVNVSSGLFTSINFSDRNYNKTPNGNAKTWNGLTKKMQDDPPPFQFGIPQTLFSEMYREENITVTPMKVDAAVLHKFLLNPKGNLSLHLNGTGIKHEDYQDTEQQISIDLNLSPRD